MGSELPHLAGGSDVVLYPSSAKASTDLQDSLTAAGFKVTRINTYNTVRSSSQPHRAGLGTCLAGGKGVGCVKAQGVAVCQCALPVSGLPVCQHWQRADDL